MNEVIGSGSRGRRIVPRAVSVVTLSLLMFASGCSDIRKSVGATPSGSGADPTAEIDPSDITARDFDPSLFDESSATFDNQWWPSDPGMRWVLKGRAFDEGELIHRRVVFTVTDLTKVVAGVRTRVSWDRDYDNGHLTEPELIFLAQDRYGNIWHLGEYREVYEDEFVGGRVWVVGDPEGARAGIMMQADPQPDTPSYSEGFAPPPWDWNDRARIDAMGVRTCVPVGCFDDVLVIDEFEPSVPHAHQLKYYAPGVGNIRVGWRGAGEEEREVLKLVKFVRLDPEALAKARARALLLEYRAYAYARTDPAQPDD